MLEQVCQLARIAGDAIMEVYDGKQPMDVASKKDDSPVTAADLAAHKVIMHGLLALTPDIPVLSEEDPPDGRCGSTGSATGWWIRWTAPKNLLNVTVNLPSISP
jgi:3'-phosphoadenosine 5'-phosphosulfate (PAPS) 3'-phosphatase